MVGCLLVLGVNAVAEVVEADGYYWDYAVDRFRFSSQSRKEGRVDRE